MRTFRMQLGCIRKVSLQKLSSGEIWSRIYFLLTESWPVRPTQNSFYIKRASSCRVSDFPESKISLLMYIVNVHQKCGHLTLVDDKFFCHFWIISRILWKAFSINGWALGSWWSWHATEMENKFAFFVCVMYGIESAHLVFPDQPA